MAELRALIAAAGTGSRAGLSYPKTLHPVLGRPILIRLLDLLEPYDGRPTVIVSPSGRGRIGEALAEHGREAYLVVQQAPTGMGDAILCFRDAPAHATAEDVLLVWGDIPLLRPDTIAETVRRHREAGNDFTFATRHVDQAYTVVGRDAEGRVTSLVETREEGSEPRAGERDIGLFVFRPGPVLEILERRPEGALGKSTGEHGFLYVVRQLAEAGYKVEALPIAGEADLISLNRLSDIEGLPSGTD